MRMHRVARQLSAPSRPRHEPGTHSRSGARDLDAKPIVEAIAFRSNGLESPAAELRRFWSGKVVVPREHGPVDYELMALQLRRLAIGRVSCSVASTIRASALRPMLQVPIDNSAHFQVGRKKIAIGPREAVWLPPGHEYTASVGSGTTLFLQVDPAVLFGGLPAGRAGRVRHWTMRCVRIDALQASGFDLHAEIDPLLQAPASPASGDGSAEFADLENRVVSWLTESLLDRGGLWHFFPSGLVLAERAAQWIDSDLPSPISLESLAGRFRVSSRWLQKCFMARWGVAPMDYVMYRRLALARSCLLSPDDPCVTNVAVRCGFSHLGRFAGLYRRTYGESPSATVTRARIRRQFPAVARLT